MQIKEKSIKSDILKNTNKKKNYIEKVIYKESKN